MDFLLNTLGNESLTHFLSESMKSDVFKMTIAFLIAARLHRKWVKKDMSEQFTLLRGAIDHVAEVMGRRIDGLDLRIDRLEQSKSKTKD